jgi:hypothetical protein
MLTGRRLDTFSKKNAAGRIVLALLSGTILAKSLIIQGVFHFVTRDTLIIAVTIRFTESAINAILGLMVPL